MANIDSHIVIMLRTIINDLDDTDYTYTDTRLEQVIGVAAMFVNKDIGGTYVVDVNGPTITPNPVDNHDDLFINLLVIKSACLIDQGTFRTKAAVAGLMAKAGPATLETSKHLDGFKMILESGPCGTYQAMLTDYKLGSGALCHAILSPFINDNFDPASIGGHSNNNRFIR